MAFCLFLAIVIGLSVVSVAESPSASVVGAGISGPPSTSVAVQGGGTVYFYVGTDDGKAPTVPIDFSQDVNIFNSVGLPVVTMGHSASNVGTFNASGDGYPMIGGIAVTGSGYQEEFFGGQGIDNLSYSFKVPSTGLVVFLSAAANTMPTLNLSVFENLSAIEIATDAASAASHGGTILLAHAYLSAGNYSFELTAHEGSNPSSGTAIGLTILTFPESSSTSTTANYTASSTTSSSTSRSSSSSSSTTSTTSTTSRGVSSWIHVGAGAAVVVVIIVVAAYYTTIRGRSKPSATHSP